jgi:hypothetical protein
MYGGRFLRDRHVVRGGKPYEGETIYAVDPATKRLGYTYFSSDGMVITGDALPGTDGIVFPSRYTTAKGVVELEAIWSRVGDTAYRVRNRQKTGDGWKELWTMELRRR